MSYFCCLPARTFELQAVESVTARSCKKLKNETLEAATTLNNESYRKPSNCKEVLAACRIQMQETSKKPQEVAGLRMEKEVLAHALCLGCTVGSILQ